MGMGTPKRGRTSVPKRNQTPPGALKTQKNPPDLKSLARSKDTKASIFDSPPTEQDVTSLGFDDFESHSKNQRSIARSRNDFDSFTATSLDSTPISVDQIEAQADPRNDFDPLVRPLLDSLPTSANQIDRQTVDEKQATMGKPLNKRAFNSIGRGNPGRNLDPFKDEILKLAKDHSVSFIKRHLEAKHKIKFPNTTLHRRLATWSGTVSKSVKVREGSKRNLTPWKTQLLEWDQAGSSLEEMSARLKRDFDVTAWAVYIGKALSFWKSAWRKMDEHPGIDELEFVPVDLWTKEELQVLEAEIKTASLEDAKDKHDQLPDFERWVELLVLAACHDPTIQALMVKEELQPGHHWSSKRRFDKLWVLGLQLPGAYSHESVDTSTKIMGKVDSLTPRVLEKVHSTLKDCLEDCISLAIKEHGEDFLQPASSMMPATTPPKCVSNLLRICRHEISQRQCRVRLREILAQIPYQGAHPCLEKCYDYLEAEESATSVVDQFTSAVLDELDFWKQPWMALENLPALKPSDMDIDETYKRPKEYASQGKGDEAAREANVHEDIRSDSSDDDSETQPASVHQAKNHQDHNHGKLYLVLSDWVLARITPSPMVFKRWRTPTSGPLLGFPPARFQAETWEPTPVHIMNIDRVWEVDDEDNEARRSSQKLGSFHTINTGRPVAIHQTNDYEKSVHYTAEIRKSQTAEEKQQFEAIIRRMCACISRPPGADKLPKQVDWGMGPRDDNWYHCRRLLQIIAQRCQFTIKAHRSFEEQLMMILAAMEGGSTEAVVWVIALEGILTRISKYAD